MEETGLNIANVIDPGEAMTIIYHHEEIIKAQNKRVIGYVSKQGQILKKFRDTENFVENVGKIRSTVYFKTEIYKFLKKYSALRKFTLP